MAFVGNFLWFVLGGLFLAIGWYVAGLLLCITVIGMPFGLAAFRIGGFVAFPFGKELVDARMLGEKRLPGTGLANVLWVVLAGFWLSLGHIVAGCLNLLLFFLVLPVVWAKAHFNLAQASFSPLGKRPVTRDMAKVARTRHANKVLDRKGA
jgi:uncharacterized membrane protein YccF (DUF307 family)